jgi:hypothetical protein
MRSPRVLVWTDLSGIIWLSLSLLATGAPPWYQAGVLCFSVYLSVPQS